MKINVTLVKDQYIELSGKEFDYEEGMNVIYDCMTSTLKRLNLTNDSIQARSFIFEMDGKRNICHEMMVSDENNRGKRSGAWYTMKLY